MLAVPGRPERGPRVAARRIRFAELGVGDYVTLQGRSFSFETTLVPGETQRAQLIVRHFSRLPDGLAAAVVLCKGTLRIACPGVRERLGEYAGGGSGGGGVLLSTRDSAKSPEPLDRVEDGYVGDRSEASSADELESSIRSILPIMACVTMPGVLAGLVL